MQCRKLKYVEHVPLLCRWEENVEALVTYPLVMVLGGEGFIHTWFTLYSHFVHLLLFIHPALTLATA